MKKALGFGIVFALVMLLAAAMGAHAQIVDFNRSDDRVEVEVPDSFSQTSVYTYDQWIASCSGQDDRTLLFRLLSALPGECNGLSGDVEIAHSFLDQAISPRDHLGPLGFDRFVDGFGAALSTGALQIWSWGYNDERLAQLSPGAFGSWTFSVLNPELGVDYPPLTFSAADLIDCALGLQLVASRNGASPFPGFVDLTCDSTETQADIDCAGECPQSVTRPFGIWDDPDPIPSGTDEPAVR